MTRYIPIIPNSLDSRNEFQLAQEAKLKVLEASNGLLTDISTGSPISALCEGLAFAQAELLFALNSAPEAWTATFLSQVLGIQILAAQASLVVLEFTREENSFDSPLLIRRGFRVATNDSNIIFETQAALEFSPGERIKYIIAKATSEGSITNVAANTVTNPLQSIANFVSITNPAPAYGGLDGESYLEAKSRAFSQLRRRNPISVADFADLTEDILGVGTRVIVLDKSSAPFVAIRDGIYVQPNSTADETFEAILKYRRLTNQVEEITDNDVATVMRVLDSQSSTSEHLYIGVKGRNGDSIDINILERARLLIQNRAPIGTIIHIDNLTEQNVEIEVLLQTSDTSSAADIQSILESYFLDLDPGAALDYSQISAIISRAANIVNVNILTGNISANAGLPQQSIIDNSFKLLNKSGVAIYSRAGNIYNTGVNSSNIFTYFESAEVIEAYSPSTVWNLTSVNVLPYDNEIIRSYYGALLECRNDTSAVRADGIGGTYIVANDRACINVPFD